ncbi:MAG: copper resistance system multicopper oxidase [Alphaproteobacteria bacterium]|nr:copper resistance system multicopper oxidase [Alphaproteobacteria bacterium]
MRPPSLTRRAALRIGAAAGLVSVVPGRVSFATADREDTITIERTRITIDGITSDAIAMGGSVPAPTLRWRKGQEVVIHAVNRLDEPTSIHWHGLLIEGVMDGAPGFNGFDAIPPGGTYTYRFRLRQAGTYWYHSHSGMQEQAGMYGAIVIDPAGRDPVRTDRDYVVVLSDHAREDPKAIYRKLKIDPGYYNRGKRTLIDFFREIGRDGFAAAMRDRLEWGEMRMDPTDLADVTGYQFLVNGRGPADNWTALFNPGERIRLRFINAAAMSFFDVRIPGLALTVVAADGQNVAPVRVDEFRFGVGETYDVVVLPTEDKPYTIFAEPLDRSGYARATLATRAGLEGPMPERRPRVILSMADMGAAHAGMGHAGADHGGHAMHAGHGTHGAQGAHGAQGGHGAHGAQGGHGAHGEHGAHGGRAAPPRSPGAPAIGWDDAGTPSGRRALRYADLKALARNPDPRPPTQEIELRLTGIMERYIWTLNGGKFDHHAEIRVAEGDRLRIRFVNETMMAHPMHLHGTFLELENGEAERRPLKHVVIVPPGREVSALLTANEPGDWPLHCHLLYHMTAGMMTRFVVERRTASR